MTNDIKKRSRKSPDERVKTEGNRGNGAKFPRLYDRYNQHFQKGERYFIDNDHPKVKDHFCFPNVMPIFNGIFSCRLSN